MTPSKKTENNSKENAEKPKVTSTLVTMLGAVAALITATTLLLQAGTDGWVQVKKVPDTLHPVKVSDASAKNIIPIGWIRLGSLPKDMISTVGTPLQSDSSELPITISPKQLPKVGDQVEIISDVNVREGHPKGPDYIAKQEALVTSLSAGDTVIISQVLPCPDKRLADRWAAWAEVSLP